MPEKRKREETDELKVSFALEALDTDPFDKARASFYTAEFAFVCLPMLVFSLRKRMQKLLLQYSGKQSIQMRKSRRSGKHRLRVLSAWLRESLPKGSEMCGLMVLTNSY